MSESGNRATDPPTDGGEESNNSSEPTKPLDKDEETFSEVNLALEESDTEDRNDHLDKTVSSVQSQDSSDDTPSASPRAALKPEPTEAPVDDEKIVVKFELGGTPEVSVEAVSLAKGTEKGDVEKGDGGEDEDSIFAACCVDPEKRKKMVRTVFVLWNFLVFVSSSIETVFLLVVSFHFVFVRLY